MKLALLPVTDYSKINTFAEHPLQSREWADFREKSGLIVLRLGAYEKNILQDVLILTLHSIPYTPSVIGYLPKAKKPTNDIITELRRIGKKYNCIAIQLEPLDIIKIYKAEELKAPIVSAPQDDHYKALGLVPSVHPLFSKYTFTLTLSASEEDLLRKFHPKTRYNIKIAEKNMVKISESSEATDFTTYLELTHETTKRQRFYAHADSYHRLQWQTLSHSKGQEYLSSHLLKATFQKDPSTPVETVVSWILFIFKDTLYYPYGASSSRYKDVMASNLMMWEAIRFGKRHGLKYFDMWGASGPMITKDDPWYGFHTFKQRYGGNLVEFAGSFDIVINKPAYLLYTFMAKIRALLLGT